MSVPVVRALVERFLIGDSADFGPYQSEIPEEPPDVEELVPGRLYRGRLVDRRKHQAEIQIFLGIEDLGGLLWEQDVRALMRIAVSENVVLPRILDGGYVPADSTRTVTPAAAGMAFVATHGGARPYRERDVRFFREHPDAAFQQFRALLHGLAELHFVGITHRNISPSGLDVLVTEERRTLRFARYELSALLSDLFRATLDSAGTSDDLRSMLLAGTHWHHVPPERIVFLLGGDANLVEEPGSDVFALATVAAEWYLGPYSEVPALRPAGPESMDDVEQACSTQRAYARRLQDELRDNRRIPADLAEILAQMLAPDASDRPRADEAVGLVAEAYDRILTAFSGPEQSRPHLLVFMPKECTDTIFHWELIDHRPDTDEGALELAAFIGDDIRGAYMTDSPLGAVPFVSGHNLEGLRNARTVIKGREVAWFCDYFRPLDEDGGLAPPTGNALIIHFVARLDVIPVVRKLEKLDWTVARRLPDVDLLERDTSPPLMARRLARAPSWHSHVEATRSRRTESGPEKDFRDAIDWLIEYQEVELAARTYPYVRVDDYEGGLVTVRHDLATDQRWTRGSSMLIKYADSPALRPEFGPFFGQLDNADGDGDVDVLDDRDGRPGRRCTVATVERWEGNDRIVLSRKRGEPPLPARGWLRPADERGTQVGIERQRAAAAGLYGATHLQGQLRAPAAIRTFEHRWAEAGKDLEGNAPQVVRDILVSEPFAAVQGPPGTGKTRVAAAAISAYLKHDPGARILVSAQSNFALDNLAARILQEIGEMDSEGRPVIPPGLNDLDAGSRPDRPLALRVTTAGTDAGSRVDLAIQPWRRLNAATRLARRLSVLVEPRLLRAEPELRDVLQEWQQMLGDDGESIVPELADRLARGANLVFATCAASTPEILMGSSEVLFDWVLVEEAAKAWPTELAMPLLLGHRWTLIGDHYQLPAHRKADLERFLKACAADRNEEMAHITPERATSFLHTFELFGGLFDAQAKEPRVGKAAPLHTLGVQFRMREPLGELVSRVFYPKPGPVVPGGLPEGRLRSYYSGDRRDGIPPVRLRTPPELSGRSLVWLDTAGVTACHDEPHWSNPGEASVVARLLEQLKPFPAANRDGYGPNPLAVLTPYREQLRLLRGISLVGPLLSTVHAFQGREADLVIVSLVRDTVHGRGGARIGAGLGHLAQRELANVLFSRARRMLVIVGRFDHYAHIMGEGGFWTRICRAVELYGDRLMVTDVLGDVPNLFGGMADRGEAGAQTLRSLA